MHAVANVPRFDYDVGNVANRNRGKAPAEPELDEQSEFQQQTAKWKVNEIIR